MDNPLLWLIIILYMTNGLQTALLRNNRYPVETPSDLFTDFFWFLLWPFFFPGELTTGRPFPEDEDHHT